VILKDEFDYLKLDPVRLNSRAIRGLEVLETCPMLPAEAFGPLCGLDSPSAAYKELAYLRLEAWRRYAMWTSGSCSAIVRDVYGASPS
jgi:hypothetical protein